MWIGANAYEQALRHLRGFGVVGVQEKFDDFVSALSARYGWGAILQAPDMHKTTHQLPVDEAARAVIEQRNAWDLKLYQTVSSELEAATQ